MESKQASRDQFERLSAAEQDLLLKLVSSVHTMRFGSVQLTVHEGKVVEIHKTERIRVQR